MVRKHQTRNLEDFGFASPTRPGMTLVVARKKESLANVSLHRARHLPRHRVLFVICARVARAHITYGVKLPATTGHPDFERVFRVQMNTLEWMPIFLPSLVAVRDLHQ